ncbi:MAG: PIG-L family deacetylase [Chloroflexota bacterium]|nr:PIG-L family deacetylase [Chloroflexota bacterium]
MSEPAAEPTHQTYMWVVAHPDDLEFSSGGTVAKFAKEGKRIILIQVTSGDRGTPDRSHTPEILGTTREDEEREAAKRLGIAEVVFLREPDGSVVPDLSLREKITRMIRTHRPDVIVTHDPFRPYALHPDHRAVGMAAHDSVYPTARDHLYYPDHLASGLEPHKTAEIWYFGSDSPDIYIDITDTFDDKIDALRAHQTQVGEAKELPDRLRGFSSDIAKDQPFELAEAFKVIKMRT